MAIAYFIPDQAKLLAGQRSSRSANNTNTRTSPEQTASRLPPNNQTSETVPVNNTVNRGYGTTINISVPTFNNTTQEPLGCWDFLTQVFCQALRFYHESSQLQPTVIQISVNFNSQTASTTNTTTATPRTTADLAATTTNNPATATATTTSLSSNTAQEEVARQELNKKHKN